MTVSANDAGPLVRDAELEAACRAYAVAFGDDPDVLAGPVYKAADGSIRPMGPRHPLWQGHAPEMRVALEAAARVRLGIGALR